MPERYALTGRVVTMNGQFDVLPQGAVYVEGRTIRAVRAAGDAPPDGFAASPRVATGGTIYPGLIELHNHLSYNILPLFQVPRLYQHRGQWASATAKRKFISGPMQLLAEQPGYVEAIVRYVECKCLLAGVTTSQGLTLSSAPGIEHHYRGVVRNVEVSDDPALPEAGHRIADVTDATAFAKALRKHRDACYILHLSEGVTVAGGSEIARRQFRNLQLPDDSWAITDALVGIHATGLTAEDFQILFDGGGSMVWSPLSNLLLYGGTAAVRAARDCGVPIALGADWSPTGSKNLLGELKVARLYSAREGNLFADRELVAMATIAPARMLKWGQLLGSIEAGKLADLIVVDGQAEGPYAQLLTASEAAIGLVVIDGVPRYGREPFMAALAANGEAWMLGGQQRRLNLADDANVPEIANLTLAQARDRLRAGLDALPAPPPIAAAPIGAAAPGARPRRLRLVLDNDGRAGRSHRALAPVTTAEVIAAYWAAAVPLSELVEPLPLDELTVAEDPATYFDRLTQQPNLQQSAPLAEVVAGLPALYQP